MLLLQNQLNSDVARFTTHIKPVLQQIRLLTGLTVGCKTRHIAIQLVLQQCCRTNYTFVARFYAPYPSFPSSPPSFIFWLISRAIKTENPLPRSLLLQNQTETLATQAIRTLVMQGNFYDVIQNRERIVFERTRDTEQRNHKPCACLWDSCSSRLQSIVGWINLTHLHHTRTAGAFARWNFLLPAAEKIIVGTRSKVSSSSTNLFKCTWKSSVAL